MGINPLLSKHIKTLEEKDMLTSILEKNKVALIHGESGSGKTVFAIKHLNDNKIIPILVDFDDNCQQEMKENGIETIIVDGYTFMKEILDIGKGKDLRDSISGSVLIIDTWTLFCKEMDYDEHQAIDMINKLSNSGFTIIILAHTKPFSGKEDVPDVDGKIYKHIKSRFYIRRTTLKSQIEYDLIIEKARGYKGKKIISLRVEIRDTGAQQWNEKKH